MLKSLKFTVAAIIALATPAAAEVELSFYLGVQGVQKSTGSGTMPGGAPFSRRIDWEGNSLDLPIYYGGRVTWWTQNNLGFGIEATHAKAYASNADLAALGVSKLELSDGHNIFTINIMKRFPDSFAGSKFTPYVGAGFGVAVPHADIQVIGSTGRTFGFEQTGLAARGIAGLKYDLNDRWALFGEYQATWSDNEITIDPDPAVAGQTAGRLNTTLITHALNFGVSYSF